MGRHGRRAAVRPDRRQHPSARGAAGADHPDPPRLRRDIPHPGLTAEHVFDLRGGLEQPGRPVEHPGGGALRTRTVARCPAGPEADGGDSPAWSRKRDRYAPPLLDEPAERVPYAELHCHSNFSFLDGASPPEELVEQAKRLGLEALALTDHDGMYGVVRFAEAAAELEVRHGVRHRALARPLRPAERRGRPGGHPPAAARPRSRGLPRALPHGQRRPAARRGEGPPGLRPRRAGRAHRGPRARAHRLPQGRGPPGAARSGGDPARRAAAAARVVRGRATWPSSSPTRACPRHRAQRRAGRARRRRRACPRSSPPRRTTPRPTGSRWPRRWPRCAPGAASTTPTAGSRPAGTAHLRSGAELTARFEHRHPGAVARAAAFGRGVRVLDPAGGARTCRRSRCRRGRPR